MNAKTRYELLAAVILLVALFGQAAFSSARMSLTTDEPMHIAMGYTSLATGDYRLLPVHIHPPLINEWAAWPLLLRPDRPDPYQVPGWEEGNLFQFSAQLVSRLGPVTAVELATRAPIMLLAILLGTLVYRWASDLFGRRAGLLALFLYAFDPGIISGAQFNTTDMGATTFGVLATFAAWRAVRRPAPARLALTGLALGAAMAAKVSGLFFAPMLALLIGITLLRTYWRRRRLEPQGLCELGKQALTWAGRLALIYALAFSVLWATYRFELGALPGLDLPVPAASHWLILQAFNKHVAEGHMAFLAGQVSQYGWWWYFPLAFVIKTPLPTLILLAASIVTAIWRRRVSWIDALWLLAIPAVYFINAMLSTIDIGYRHLLPVLPFLFIFISQLAPVFPPCAAHPVSRIPYYVLLAWLFAGTLFTFPHYLPYFNKLAGGLDGGWRYLADSNTDWGQALKELAAYQRAEGIEQARLSMFTFIDPAMYGVRYEPLTPMKGNTPAIFPSRFNPPPGDYVISATTLQGIPLADPEMYDWFRKRPPDAAIGHVMFVYHIRSEWPGKWVAQCTSPAAPLEREQLVEGLGADARLAFFDCAQSWLYPAGGTSPGWFALSNDAPAWAWRWLENCTPSYEQKRAGFSPSFRIYQSDRAGYPQNGQVRIAPSEMPLADASTAPPLDLPVTFEGGLTLLGHRLETPSGQNALQPGETLYLETTWRVESVPPRLLSLMAHALAPEGQAIAVGDALGVPISSWQPGDIFVQRHTLTLPTSAPPGTYWIETGVYWLDDGKRWAVRDKRAAGDRAVLTSLHVP